MSTPSLEQEVLHILRTRSLAGSTRKVSLDEPLGASGLGLDSLGLVQFVSSLEKHFGVEIPEDIWFDRGVLTIRNFVEIIRESRTERIGYSPRSISEVMDFLPANTSYAWKIRKAFTHAGVQEGMRWIWKRAMGKIQPLFYHPVSHVILLRDLTTEIPAVAPSEGGLVVRETPFLSEGEVADLWPRRDRRTMTQLMRQRARAGYICLTAWRENEIVGIDWLSLSGDFDSSTGLEITTADGCCYAMNLYEKYRGQGIGLALLAASLEEGRRRGCTIQVTIVQESNTRMMSVATQMFGFRQIGSIRTRRFLGQATSTWKKDGQEYRKAAVHLPMMLLSWESWNALQALIADSLPPLL